MFHWTAHLNGTPQEEEAHNRQAAVAVDNKLYYFGGYSNMNDKDQMDVYVFNTVSLRWRKLPPETIGRGRHLEVPSRRCGHTAVLIEDISYI